MKPCRFVLLQQPRKHRLSIFVEIRKLFAVWVESNCDVTCKQYESGCTLPGAMSRLIVNKKILTFSWKITNYKSEIEERHHIYFVWYQGIDERWGGLSVWVPLWNISRVPALQAILFQACITFFWRIHTFIWAVYRQMTALYRQKQARQSGQRCVNWCRWERWFAQQMGQMFHRVDSLRQTWKISQLFETFPRHFWPFQLVFGYFEH